MNNNLSALKWEEKLNYQGWPNCIRLSNNEIELVIATDIGLRILHAGYIGSQNFFYLSPEELGKQGGDQWRIYGGHRLWHAPEAIPRTYSPDNYPITFTYDQRVLHIKQPVEAATGIVKEIEISLSPVKNQMSVLHRLINQNAFPVKLSAWAISAMAAGGRAIVPQEPFGAGDEFLLPTRSLALWSYTTMDDPRWIWGKKFIQAKQDPSFSSEQKIGVLNKQGWTAYSLKGELLIKIFEFDPSVEYPDFGSNNEIYINGQLLEIETLGPYAEIPALGKTEQTEFWSFCKGIVGEDETSIEEVIHPLVESFRGEIKFGLPDGDIT